MRNLSQEKVWTYRADGRDGSWDKCQVRRLKGVRVDNYRDLAQKVAAVQFHNPNHLLLFRGQKRDYRIDDNPNKNSTIRPSIFRRDEGHRARAWNHLVARRYQVLQDAETELARRWTSDLGGQRRLVRSSVIRWAILQHYDVCDTPLLDVTHSLRVAASFATLDNTDKEAYLMVLAVPQISGAVSACAYHELQTLRLSSLCPPSAIRPHLQEGYLIGEYPELRTYTEKMEIGLYETDFGQRLIAKFRFDPRTFWDEAGEFPPIQRSALSLEERDPNDPILALAAPMRRRYRDQE